MSEKKDRFTADAEDVRPIGRPMYSHDKSSQASKDAKAKADAAKRSAEFDD